MKRVLLLHEPPDGGVAVNVLQLACRLEHHGWRPLVAGPTRSAIRPSLAGAGIPYLPVEDLLRGYGRPDSDARALRTIGQHLRRHRVDLLHCHSSKAGVLGRLAAGAMSVPVVYSPHCFGFVGSVPAGRKVASIAIERALARRTRRILCVCEAEREEALRHRIAAPERLARVYNGVEEPAPGVQADTDLRRFAGGYPLAAVVSALRRQKRVDVFLEASTTVLDASGDYRVAVVGNGPLEADLRRRAAQLGLDGHPRFGFFAFEPPSERYLKAMDVYVLPSEWEAFPIGVLEAMASGVPQIATAVGGTPEAVSAETGILVAPGDSQELAAAIIRMLADPSRRACAAAASVDRHRRSFGVDRMVAETAAVYAGVV